MAGEAVYSQDVERFNSVALSSEDDPDCGHITAVRTGNTWTIAFDLHYNKALARKHLETARQFYETAEFSLKRENWTAFVDNLFSAAELAARASLLCVPDRQFRKKTSHQDIQFRYRRHVELGNAEQDDLNTLNELAGLRDRCRYVRDDLRMGRDEAPALLAKVGNMLQRATEAPDNLGVVAGEPLDKNEAVGYVGQVAGKPVVRRASSHEAGPGKVEDPRSRNAKGTNK